MPRGKTAAVTWRVTGFCGNLLMEEKPNFFSLERVETPKQTAGTAGTPFSQPFDSWSVKFQHGGPTYIQLVQPKLPVWNYAVPVGPGEQCVVRLIRIRTGTETWELAIDMELPNNDADLVLRHAGSNLLSDALQVAESPTILAQNLLSKKFAFPIGAAIGAYALLRRGELDRLDDWTNNLCQSLPWLPDGVAIRAEHLARVGKHQEALEVLLSLPKRGFPFFSSGLTYALNRLQQYKRALKEPKRKRKLDGDIKALDALGRRLGRYAGHIDVTRPILTFMGTNPLRPSRRPGNLSRRSARP